LGDNVILCLHGRWGRAETWVPFMQHYGDRYRVIAPAGAGCASAHRVPRGRMRLYDSRIGQIDIHPKTVCSFFEHTVFLRKMVIKKIIQ